MRKWCLRSSKDDTSEKAGKRKKREVASEDYYSFPIEENHQEEIFPSSGPVSKLSSALLTSALDGGHKVRRTKVTDLLEAQLRFVIWMKR